MTRRMRRGLYLLSALVAFAGCGANPTVQPPKTTSLAHEDYERLLKRFVTDDGRVDYAAWAASAEAVATLDRFLTRMRRSTPEVSPERYRTNTERLSYWINLYNATVIREVVRRWPLPSVTEVPAVGSNFGAAGKGFFSDLRFDVGGEKLSLFDIEQRVVRSRYGDVRTQFALNCGTRSCPLMPRQAFDPHVLDSQLDLAARVFINDPTNVVVRAADRRVELSPVFGWYREQFIDYARQHSSHPAPTLIDFLLVYAEGELAGALRTAAQQDYALRYLPYDWSLNAASDALPAAVQPSDAVGKLGIGQPMPDLSFQLLNGSEWRPSRERGRVLLLDFWASYCRPCLVSFPHYDAWQRAQREHGLTVVAVAEDDSREPVDAFLASRKLSFTVALDPEHRANEPPLEVQSLPTVIVVDREGVIRYRHEGLSEQGVEAVNDQVLRLLGASAVPAAPPD